MFTHKPGPVLGFARAGDGATELRVVADEGDAGTPVCASRWGRCE